MKKLIAVLFTVMAVCLVSASAFALTTVSQSANVSVAALLSVEFASATDTTFGSGTVPWTSVVADSAFIYPTGHVTTKPDAGVICKSNGAATWYIKLGFSSANGLNGKISRYISGLGASNTGGVTNRNTGAVTPNGAIATPDAWTVIPTTATTVYSSGANDTNNAPDGDGVWINYNLNPTGLVTGTAYTGTLTYTIATTP